MNTAIATLPLIDRLSFPLDALTRQLLDGAGAGILVIDTQGRLVCANARICQMAGHSDAMLAGIAAMRLFPAADRDALWRRVRGAWGSEPMHSPIAAKLLRDGDAELEVELSTVPLREADGAVRGVILSVTDVSARKRLEAQVSHGQKLHAVGALAAGLAHDFNNLLTVIGGTAQLIGERDGVDAETHADSLEIGNSVMRGAALVQRLLGLGSDNPPEPRLLVVDDVLRALRGLLVRLMGRQTEVKLELGSAGGLVLADPTHLDQVLVNLAMNARDAMPSGGELTLRSRALDLTASLACTPQTIPAGRYVVIDVEDTGAGIAPAALPHVFDAFFTTRRATGGTGLGLATVTGVLRQSGGYVRIESVEGCGTSLHVYLPRHDPAAPQLHSPAPAARAAGSAPNPASPVVVLVDDEPAVLRMAQQALRQAGWTVITAESAEAALEMLQSAESMPHLLISDLVLPALDGAALAEAARRLWPVLPILLVSGYADARLRQTFEPGRFQFLAKPYRLAELVKLARSIAGVAPRA